MPINNCVPNEHLRQVGRLLREWHRVGKTVPRGFQGSLRDYAWACLCVHLEDDLVTYEEIYESIRDRNDSEPSKEPVPYPPEVNLSGTVYARHYWHAERQAWLPVK